MQLNWSLFVWQIFESFLYIAPCCTHRSRCGGWGFGWRWRQENNCFLPAQRHTDQSEGAQPAAEMGMVVLWRLCQACDKGRFSTFSDASLKPNIYVCKGSVAGMCPLWCFKCWRHYSRKWMGRRSARALGLLYESQEREQEGLPCCFRKGKRIRFSGLPSLGLFFKVGKGS